MLTRTLLSLLAAQRQDVTTVTAPICAHVGKICEAMRDAMIELRLVWICLCVRLGNTLGHHFRVTLLVTSVFAV